jgi:hypothetical protein
LHNIGFASNIKALWAAPFPEALIFYADAENVFAIYCFYYFTPLMTEYMTHSVAYLLFFLAKFSASFPSASYFV